MANEMRVNSVYGFGSDMLGTSKSFVVNKGNMTGANMYMNQS